MAAPTKICINCMHWIADGGVYGKCKYGGTSERETAFDETCVKYDDGELKDENN